MLGRKGVRMNNWFNIERRESGPAHLDKTGEEYYAAESEVTDQRVDAADDLWGVELEESQA